MQQQKQLSEHASLKNVASTALTSQQTALPHPPNRKMPGKWNDGSMSTRLSRSILVGRDAELARLDGLFSAARDHHATAAIVTGEAGIGKSRLITEMVGAVRAEADVLIGYCIDLGRAATPYGPLLEVLRMLVEKRGADAVLAALRADHPGRAAILLLLPELIEPQAPGAAREHTSHTYHAAEEDLGPEQLHAAISTLLQAAAETHPILIIIEDLHWADEGTLTILTSLLRRLTASRIMVVCTMRNDGRRSDPARRFAAEAERARVLEHIPLTRLNDGEVRAMITGLVDRPLDPGSFEQLLERSEGVPFFVEELLENAAAPLSDSLRDVLLARYDRLSDPTASLVRIMSISQSALSHDMLAELSMLPEAALESALREAIDAGVLMVDRVDYYAFRHALLREAIRGELLPGERTRLHRALAGILQRIADGEAQNAPFPELAYHWEQAKEHERSFVASLAAMQQAAARYAYAPAAFFGEQVLERWDDIDRAEEKSGMTRTAFLEQLSLILADAGRTERGIAIIDLALSLTGAHDAPAARASLLRRKAHFMSYLGAHGREPIISEALALLQDDHEDDRLSADLYNLLASAEMRAGHFDAALKNLSETLRHAERSGDLAQISIALNLSGAIRSSIGDIEGGLGDFERSLALAASNHSQMWCHVNRSDSLNILGRYRDAITAAETGLELTRRYGVDRTTGAIIVQNLIEPLLELGEIQRVEEILSQGFDIQAVRMQRVYLLSSRIRALAWRGRADEAEVLFQEWREPLEQTAELERQVWYARIFMRTAIAIARDDFESAQNAIAQMWQTTKPRTWSERRLLLEAGWIAAELRSRGRDVSSFTAGILSLWETQHQALQDPSCTLVLRGLLAPSEASLSDALAAAESDSVPRIFRVIVRTELIRFLIGAGDRSRAKDIAKETLKLSAQLEHATLERHVSELARALGIGRASVASQAPTASQADPILTPREQQVLDLVAEGLSNREIGERLYISAKTVSVHVSAVLRKLGVSTRTQAARSALVSTPRGGSNDTNGIV